MVQLSDIDTQKGRLDTLYRNNSFVIKILTLSKNEGKKEKKIKQTHT